MALKYGGKEEVSYCLFNLGSEPNIA
jgi:hypothetical protein